MRILDKYILREYLRIFLLIVLSFSLLFIAIDIFDRAPKLIEKSASIKQMAYYFLARTPYLIVFTAPIAILLSGLFLMSNLSKYNESIAIRAAGISIFRMVRPILIFGFLFSIGHLVFSDYVLPRAEYYRRHLYKVSIMGGTVQDVKTRNNLTYKGKDNTLYFIGHFDGYRNVLKNIEITQYDPGKGLLVKKVSALQASWQDSVWVFKKCTVRNFVGGQLLNSRVYKKKVIEAIEVTPTDFIKSAKEPLQMTYFELKEYIARLGKIGEAHIRESVDLQFKLSFPIANFIILLFSVPLASTSVRSKGRGMIFILGLVICFTYLTMLRFSQSLGYSEVLSPLVAAWLPNLIYLIIGSIFVIKAEV